MAITPVPSMTPVPHFPALSERAAGTYNASAYAFGTHMSVTFNAELLAMANNVKHNADEAQASAEASALSAAQAAEASALSAAQAADAYGTTLAATAFKGPWSSLTGPLAVPATVWHQGQYWVLLQPLADVASVAPGSDLTKWAALIAGAAPSVQLVANATAQPGIRYLFCVTGITLTLPASMNKGDYFGFVDLVGDKTCKVDFNGHKFRGRDAGLVTFDLPFSGGGAAYEDATKGLV